MKLNLLVFCLALNAFSLAVLKAEDHIVASISFTGLSVAEAQANKSLAEKLSKTIKINYEAVANGSISGPACFPEATNLPQSEGRKFFERLEFKEQFPLNLMVSYALKVETAQGKGVIIFFDVRDRAGLRLGSFVDVWISSNETWGYVPLEDIAPLGLSMVFSQDKKSSFKP